MNEDIVFLPARSCFSSDEMQKKKSVLQSMLLLIMITKMVTKRLR